MDEPRDTARLAPLPPRRGPAARGDEPAGAVVVRGLRKSFGRTRALDGLDLSVATGEVHGLLGPNGAGKSTTLRILLGVLGADGGRVRLLGGDPRRDAVRLHRRLVHVPGDVALWPSLTGGEVVDLLGRLHGGLDETRRRELVERLRLDPTRRCRTYSRGNRQKVVLVAAFACPHELMLLDEPTAGLDPLMEAEFQALVREEAAAGRTVLLSSHLLSEVEAVCDRVSIVREGRLVDSGALADLRHLSRTRVTATAVGRGAFRELQAHPAAHDLVLVGATATFSVEPAALAGVLGVLARADVTAVTVRPPNLEELFLQHYRDVAP